jgi:hypothetical protein
MTAARNDSAELSIVVTQYETLRSAALGDALPPGARSGLMLFLCRGMWGWARALATMSAFEQPVDSRQSSWKTTDEHRTVMHIFAAMAIRANY